MYAIAHFGVLYVVPKISLKCKLSTFTTAPSIPNDSFSLSSPIFLIASIASSIVLHSFLTGTTLNPRFSSLFNSTKCEFSESNVFASYFCTLNTNISNGLCAVIFEFNCLKEPAAAFLAFANRGSSSISLSSFIFSNSFVPINTSPRTVILIFSFISFGICLIVFRFSVTSSPICPFPLVAPCTNIPFSYFRAVDNPSIFVSTTYFSSSLFSSDTFLTLVSKSLSSSNENISCKL